MPNLGHKRKYYIFLFESQMSRNVSRSSKKKKMLCSGGGLHWKPVLLKTLKGEKKQPITVCVLFSVETKLRHTTFWNSLLSPGKRQLNCLFFSSSRRTLGWCSRIRSVTRTPGWDWNAILGELQKQSLACDVLRYTVYDFFLFAGQAW